MTGRLRPRLSILGMGSGIVGGLGALTLLQQAGSVYPTRTVTIVAALLGLAWGVAVPSLRRYLRVRKIDRRIAALRARVAAG
jgi:hypothetical protein